MKRKYHIAILLVLLGLSIYLPAQNNPRNLQWGVGLGVNLPRFQGRSGSYEGWFFDSHNTVEIDRGSSLGIQGNAIASFQLSNRWQVQGGLGASYVETQATVKRHSTSSGIFGGSSSSTSLEKVDEKFVLMDIPLYLRWHIRPKSGARDGANFFMDFGAVLELPIVNKSHYEITRSSSSKSSEQLKIETLSPLFAMGIAIGDEYALTFGWSPLKSEQTNNISVRKLTLTRFF